MGFVCTALMVLVAVSSLVRAGDWYMAGANPERTSWVSHEVTGTLTPRWSRPIEAYIDQKVQLVISNDRVYVASSRGLYCLDAVSGQRCSGWTDYHTEMPLGHSPTVVGGVVYVGSFDRRIHALNASTGQRVWVSPPAGAGFSVNPVVVNNMVYAGNRDGYFYAYRTGNGSLAWQYPPAGQPPLGPIAYSPAYDGTTDTLFFAADDNYAYALRAATGTLLWKSSRKLPGDRYRSWWPVIYRDYVVFSGMRPYFWHDIPNTQAWGDIYTNATLYGNQGYLGPVFPSGSAEDETGITFAWPGGSLVMDGSHIANRVGSNPRLMQTQVHLNKNSGEEFTRPYAPFVFSGKHAHAQHPPVVMPDGVMYTTGHSHQGGAGITRAQALGLHHGTSYLRLLGLDTAADEPQYLSGGGTFVYRNLCCSRVGDRIRISGGGTQIMWAYGSQRLEAQLPGYHDGVWYIQPDFLSQLRGWYHGQYRDGYRSVNGHYHNHGDQNPIIPHITSDGVGRIYTHRNNVIISYANQGSGVTTLPMLRIGTPLHQDIPVLSPAVLQGQLAREVAKIVDAPGYLKPAYFHGSQNLVRQINYYFYNPGDLVYTLTRAYPLLSPALQSRVRTYLQGYYDYYFGSTMYAYTGWREPVQRNANDFPPEALAQFSAAPRSTTLTSPILGQSFGWGWSYPQNNLYALWKYAELFPESAQDAYAKARSRLELRSLTDSAGGVTFEQRFREYPFELHGFIAGYLGFIRLNDMVLAQTGTRPDAATYNTAQQRLTQFLNHRSSAFEKDSPYTDPATLLPVGGLNAHRRKINLCRNFMLLVPEVGDHLHDTIFPLVRETVDEYNYVGPYWFVTAYEAGYQESTTAPLNDYDGLFQAKALILREPYEELQKYIDSPLFPIGDLFYINNLIAAVEAADTGGDTRPSPPRNLRITVGGN
jgi:hypothetical protein